MVSQAQLATELDLSQALVSLALNGRKEGISAATYDRIWAHALRRGYRPKGMRPAAAPDASGGQIGFIIRSPLRLNTPSVYFNHVLEGLHVTLERHRLSEIFVGAEDQLTPAKLRRFFPPHHTVGALALLGEVSRPFFERLRRLGLPIVALAARYPGQCHSVLGDEPHAVESLVQYLYTLGHRRFGWLGGNVGLGRHESRLLALKSSLAARDLELHSNFCVTLKAGDRAEGAEAVHLLEPHFGRPDFPTAFVCYNTLMAAGATRAFERAGRSVPRDVSVASADFSRFALEHQPRITAAGCDPEKLGAAAANLIARVVAGKHGGELSDLLLPAQFFAGDTTGPAAADQDRVERWSA